MLSRKQNGCRNVLSVGTIPVMSQYSITPVLLDFQKLYPDCSLQVTEEDPKNLKRFLTDQKCELAFLRESGRFTEDIDHTDSQIIRIPYLTDFLVAVLPDSHPLSRKDEISLRDLQSDRFCFLKESSMMYDLCRMACQQAGFIPDIVFDSHRPDSILDMVTYGGCTALLMDLHLKNHPVTSASPHFSTVKIVPPISTQISLCYLKNASLSRMAQPFIAYFIKRTNGSRT